MNSNYLTLIIKEYLLNNIWNPSIFYFIDRSTICCNRLSLVFFLWNRNLYNWFDKQDCWSVFVLMTMNLSTYFLHTKCLCLLFLFGLLLIYNFDYNFLTIYDCLRLYICVVFASEANCCVSRIVANIALGVKWSWSLTCGRHYVVNIRSDTFRLKRNRQIYY